MHAHSPFTCGIGLDSYELRGQDTVSRGRNPNEGQVIAMVAWLDRCNHVVPTNWLGKFKGYDLADTRSKIRDYGFDLVSACNEV